MAGPPPSQRYLSTRGRSYGFSFEEAVLKGLASDGGLFQLLEWNPSAKKLAVDSEPAITPNPEPFPPSSGAKYRDPSRTIAINITIITISHEPETQPWSRPIGSHYLPPPLVHNDSLLPRALRAIQCGAHVLDYPRRQILCAFLPHCRCADTVERIIKLSASEMSTLAEVLHEGLILARNRGGRKKSSTTLAGHSAEEPDGTPEITMDDSLHELAQAPQLSDVIAPPVAEDDALEEDLSPAALKRRNATLRKHCLSRQLNSCLITQTDTELNFEACHILPHSLAAKTNYHSCIFCFTVAVLLGAEWQHRIWELAGGRKSWSTANCLVLGMGMHTLFDKGLFMLHPLPSSRTEHRLMDVQFSWETQARTGMCTTLLPRDTEEQIAGTTQYTYSECDDQRRINYRDCFRFFTNDPRTLPLPAPELLELHAALWALIGAVGLSQAGNERVKAGMKRRRVVDDMLDNAKRPRGRSRPDDRTCGERDSHSGSGPGEGQSRHPEGGESSPGGGGASSPQDGGQQTLHTTDSDSKRSKIAPGVSPGEHPSFEVPHGPCIASSSQQRFPSRSSTLKVRGSPIPSRSNSHSPEPIRAPLRLPFSPWLLSQVLECRRRLSERNHSATPEDDWCSADSDDEGTEPAYVEDEDCDEDAGMFGQYAGWRDRMDAKMRGSRWLREVRGCRTTPV
ncbi:hypothetical protein FN846DRAFT_886222 [Sphaerosporella brunnea]|uniref:HNH nuclease domain-containing protein n=1 Tax=Sphaerosporella brunnea TaxID=1250544 RepID=A0A5J5F9A5_9PEZI|nr:hypothetical protein FN846DRAFT_886222 [Sphaerosporella brunnea]